MFVQSKLLDFMLRAAAGLLIGVLFGWLLSEFSYRALSDKQSVQRDPNRVEIVIPYGTAAQVEEGVPNRSLPEDMVFVEGDLLVVKNEDVVAHQLGPLWVPPNTSSVLALDTANQYTYECSFQPSKFIGLDVRQRVTGGTRFAAILAIALPTGMMLAVYSYLLPDRKKKIA